MVAKAAVLSLAAACLAHTAEAAQKKKRPNLLFLHDESTDGRTYQRDMGHLVPIPHIRSLQDRGVNFVNFYCNVPICAPSRASVWSGRQPHNGLHKHNNITVRGYWNNYEGVGACTPDPESHNSGRNDGCDTTVDGESTVREQDLIAPFLAESGYHTLISGKTDWAAGGHSLTTMVDSWSIYARFPYSIPEQGGWHIWGDCGGNLTVLPGKATAHARDWQVLNETTAWIKSAEAKSSTPWFAFQGMNIVHPGYNTNEYYLAKINQSAIVIPAWPEIGPEGDVHPCDMQASMKKGCALPKELAPTESGMGLNTREHKRAIRAGYYAMIAEYDDMVGAYIQALEDGGWSLDDDTVMVCSSDHVRRQLRVPPSPPPSPTFPTASDTWLCAGRHADGAPAVLQNGGVRGLVARAAGHRRTRNFEERGDPLTAQLGGPASHLPGPRGRSIAKRTLDRWPESGASAAAR
jgi:arylsulfatase A-like enzyme